jgi:hypothetical protein
MWMKIVFSLLLLTLLALNFSLGVDAAAMELHDASFERAMITFGLAKALNGVISLLQGTQLSFTPVGVGLTFSIGEILDPLNDLVEQFSWVMLFASISLGLQKFLLLLSGKLFLQIALAASILLSTLFVWMKKTQSSPYFVFSIKILFLLLLLRFGALVFVYSSEALYLHLLQNEYQASAKVIEDTTSSLEELQKKSSAMVVEKKEEGFFDRMSAKYDNLVESLNLSKQLASLQASLEDASAKIITLITIFILLSVVLPLLYLWLLVVSLRLIFRVKIEEETLYTIFNSEKNRV